MRFRFSGSRTVRTEEAVLITLAALSEKIQPVDAPPEFKLKGLIAQSEDTGNIAKFGEPMKRKNKVKKVKHVANGLKKANDSDSNFNGFSKTNEDLSRFD